MISHLDHLVLTVADLEQTLAFYTTVLGMESIVFNGRHALKFGNQKINLHEAGKEFEPKAHRATPGSADLCLIVSIPIPEVMARLQRLGIEAIEGPVLRTGATGPIESLYIRDPDLNLIELSVYQTAGNPG